MNIFCTTDLAGEENGMIIWEARWKILSVKNFQSPWQLSNRLQPRLMKLRPRLLLLILRLRQLVSTFCSKPILFKCHIIWLILCWNNAYIYDIDSFILIIIDMYFNFMQTNSFKIAIRLKIFLFDAKNKLSILKK